MGRPDMNGGSCQDLAGKVAQALLEQGCTNLESKIGSYIASFGGNNWQTDRTLADRIPKDRSGSHYHRESVGRARRMLSKAGFLKVKRVFPGQTPEGADYASSHGTTSKFVRWSVLGVTRPPKSERRKQAERLCASERHTRLGPRYASTTALVAPEATITPGTQPVPDPELALVLDTWTASMQSLRARRAGSTPQGPARQGHGPPE